MSDSENERLESPPIESPIDAGDDDNADANSGIDSGDDLFGDVGGGDEDDGQLSEHSLGPEDDEEPERYGDDDDDNNDRDDHQVTKEELVMDVDLFRHRIPKPSDGTLQSLRVPSFIRINPEEYNAGTYEPTSFELKDSHSQHPKSVVRFRRDAATGALQSNATFYRWDDGSVTLAIGDEHFEVLTKSLAPAAATKAGSNGATGASKRDYQELQDAHYYAAAAHLSSSLLLTVGHVAEQYSVRANRTVADDALQRLTDRLHAASQTSAGSGTNMMIIRTMRDPELAKKEAELAEKERERARRRRENASARLDGGFGGSGGGGGGSRSGRAGALSISDLEGGGRRGAGRKRGAAGAPRAKRRKPDYDSDDELPHGARRNDEYDKEDDFIAPSDDELSDDNDGRDDDEEEEEEELESDDEDDEEDERDQRRRGKHHKARRAKRQRTAEAEDAQDAEADPDDDLPARRARRHIIDEDDDDDE